MAGPVWALAGVAYPKNLPSAILFRYAHLFNVLQNCVAANLKEIHSAMPVQSAKIHRATKLANDEKDTTTPHTSLKKPKIKCDEYLVGTMEFKLSCKPSLASPGSQCYKFL